MRARLCLRSVASLIPLRDSEMATTVPPTAGTLTLANTLPVLDAPLSRGSVADRARPDAIFGRARH
jgi:hypothetical protein